MKGENSWEFVKIRVIRGQVESLPFWKDEVTL